MTREQADSVRDIFIPRYYRPGASARTTLTRERIRQIETIAIRKFRRELSKRGHGKEDLIS